MGASREVISPEAYRDLSRHLDETRVVRTNDADTTNFNNEWIRERWDGYCDYLGEIDTTAALQNVSKGRLMSFLKWMLDNSKVPKHRKPKEKSTKTNYRSLKLVYKRSTGRTIDANDNEEVLNYINGPLRDEYGLDLTSKSKPVMNVDDLLMALTHHWSKDISQFPDERQRVQLAVIMLFAAFTASRPGELVDGSRKRGRRKAANQRAKTEGGIQLPWNDIDNDDFDEITNTEPDGYRPKALCYEDVSVVLLPNPKDGTRNVLAMEIRLANHKGSDNKPKPTTFLFHEADFLIFCPITHLLSLAFPDKAFEAKGLDSMEKIYSLRITNGLRCLKLHWRESILKTPIFRQAVRSHTGYETSPKKALTYATFHHYIERLGTVTGFEEKLTGYCLRRGAGNVVDADASKAVRDKVMRHKANSTIFEEYLNERVKFDVQAAFLEEPSEKGLFRAFAHMSMTCDPRAPTSVPYEELETFPLDLDVPKHLKYREEVKKKIKDQHGTIIQAKGTKLYDEMRCLDALIHSADNKRRRHAKQVYRKTYFRKSHTDEVERQLNGSVWPEQEQHVELIIPHQIKERARLETLLCRKPTGLSASEIRQRRVDAVAEMVKLCHRQETRRPRRIPARAKKPPAPKVEKIVIIKDQYPLVCKPTQCPFCLGNERKTYPDRTRTFSSPGNMMTHVEKSHLRFVQADQEIACPHPKCALEKITLNHVSHLKNHIFTIHKIALREPRFMDSGVPLCQW